MACQQNPNGGTKTCKSSTNDNYLECLSTLVDRCEVVQYHTCSLNSSGLSIFVRSSDALDGGDGFIMLLNGYLAKRRNLVHKRPRFCV